MDASICTHANIDEWGLFRSCVCVLHTLSRSNQFLLHYDVSLCCLPWLASYVFKGCMGYAHNASALQTNNTSCIPVSTNESTNLEHIERWWANVLMRVRQTQSSMTVTHRNKEAKVPRTFEFRISNHSHTAPCVVSDFLYKVCRQVRCGNIIIIYIHVCFYVYVYYMDAQITVYNLWSARVRWRQKFVSRACLSTG